MVPEASRSTTLTVPDAVISVAPVMVPPVFKPPDDVMRPAETIVEDPVVDIPPDVVIRPSADIFPLPAGAATPTPRFPAVTWMSPELAVILPEEVVKLTAPIDPAPEIDPASVIPPPSLDSCLPPIYRYPTCGNNRPPVVATRRPVLAVIGREPEADGCGVNCPQGRRATAPRLVNAPVLGDMLPIELFVITVPAIVPSLIVTLGHDNRASTTGCYFYWAVRATSLKAHNPLSPAATLPGLVVLITSLC